MWNAKFNQGRSTAWWKRTVYRTMSSQKRSRSLPSAFSKLQVSKPLNSPYMLNIRERNRKGTWLERRTLYSSPLWLRAHYLVTWWLFSPSVEENNIEYSLCPHSIAQNCFKRYIFKHGGIIRSSILGVFLPRYSSKAVVQESGVLFPAWTDLLYGVIDFDQGLSECHRKRHSINRNAFLICWDEAK